MTRHLYTGIGIADFSENGTNYLFLQYANAMGGPLWGINLTVNMDFKFKPYDRANWGLLEENSSFGFWFQMPYNFGENLSNNHLFSGAITLTDRNANLIKGIDDAGEEYIYIDSTKYLPMPLSGAEALFSASHTWLNRRNHKNNSMIPTQGQGLMLSFQFANSGIYGDFDYSLITADAFINYKFHEKFPVVVFGRVKSIMMLGDNPPPQDMPAITNDTPFYIAGNNILGTDEVVHLRGWNDWRLGDRLIFGSLEARLGNNKFILAQFIDFGNSWYAGQESDEWLFTGGYEVRVNIGFIVLAYGSAQDFNRWREGLNPYNYLRMTLVNPF
jgi:outer membrane protein assembly factor BamA